VLAAAVLLVLALAITLLAWHVTGWAAHPARRTTPRTLRGARHRAPRAVHDTAHPARCTTPRTPARPAVVLVHGICGFGSVGVGPLRLDYFRRVAARLEAEGFAVHTARLPPLGGVPARADALRRLLDRVPQDRVTMIAHSMGGLDARWAIAAGAAPRVHTLITIGTPHAGTPIADLLARGPLARMRALAARFGLSSEAIEWLTTWRAAALDRELGTPADVRECCVVAATANRARVHPLLRFSHAYLARGAAASDGLVPAASQRRGEILAELELDHWAQVGWSSRHDAASLMLGMLAPPDPARLFAA